MILTLTEVAADVSALTGTSVVHSDPRLRLFLTRAASTVISSAPDSMLAGALPLEGEIYPSATHPGVGMIPLPGDFLRLKAFRLRGWPGDVTRLIGPEEAADFALRNSLWPEIAGSAHAPRCYRVSFPGGEALEFHAAPGDARDAVVEHALYIPRPVIHDHAMRIPAPLREEIIIMTADMFTDSPHTLSVSAKSI